MSRNGGATWTEHQLTPATNNTHSRNGFGRSGCTVRTDSQGAVYVFDFQFGFNATTAAAGQIQMIKSTDGGTHWSRPVNIIRAFDTCNAFEPSIGRCVEDGVGGARSDLSPAPSVDIANNAPTGAGATNRMVISWVDGRDGLNREHVMISRSSNGGASWTAPAAIERGVDRGYYSAPAISPDGQDVWVVYNAFTTPFRNNAIGLANDRQLVGVVLHADWPATTFTEVHRGQSGDARGSSQNDLAAEFLGDYVYAAATNTYGAGVWNDVRGSGGLRRCRPPPPGVAPGGRRHWPADRGAGGAARCRGPRSGCDHGGRGRRARRPTGVPGELRELRHLRRGVRRPDAVDISARGGARAPPPRAPLRRLRA